MSEPAPFDRRLVGGVALGALAGVALLGRDAMPLGLSIAGLAALYAIWRTWQARSHGSRVLRGLEAQWLELPGAERQGGEIVVHDGMQPLAVRLGRRKQALVARVATPIGESPLAFRLWPPGAPPPPLDPEGAPVGGPPVERAARVEARLAGQLRVEASDEPRVDGILDGEVTAALLVIAREAAGSFAGVTYDGQRLAVHLRGPVVADPEQAARLARALWQPFLP